MSTAERRQTPTERLHELAMSIASRQPSQPESSVELTRNAKGDVQIAVTVRDADPAVALAVAVEQFDTLAATYPRAQEGSGNGG